MTNDIAKIAAGLTKAQREALASEPWSMMKQYKAGILEPLVLGILAPDAYGHKLTPLGIQVRDHIKGQQE